MFIQSTHNKIYTLQILYLQNLHLQRSIHGGYPCTGGDVRGEGDTLSGTG